MREETRLIKKIVKSSFSGNAFGFLYREGYLSGRASDKLIISKVEPEMVACLMEVLKKNTKDICVYMRGTPAETAENAIPKIRDAEDWFEPDSLEYIEIRKK